MRKEGSLGEADRWLVSAEMSSGGRSYGAKISETVSVVEAGSVIVSRSVSFNVA